MKWRIHTNTPKNMCHASVVQQSRPVGSDEYYGGATGLSPVHVGHMDLSFLDSNPQTECRDGIFNSGSGSYHPVYKTH